MRDGMTTCLKRHTEVGNRCRQRGVETVELAILLPVFLFLLFGVIDFARLMFTQTSLQHAMREGGRYGVTGGRLDDPNDPKTKQSRIESIKAVVAQAATGIEIDKADISVSSGQPAGPQVPNSAGNAGDILTISLRYRFEPITPMLSQFFDDGAYKFTVSTSFKNEPFPPSVNQ